MNKVVRYEPFSDSISDASDLRKERRDQSIFVSIVSYEDENIYKTVDSLYANALYPDRLFVSVVMAKRAHSDGFIMNDIFDNFPHLMVHSVVVDKTATPDTDEVDSEVSTYGALKAIANQKYNNETFYMTVSSSSRFDPNWDEVLLKYYQSIKRAIGERFIISSFPRGCLTHDDVVDGFSFYTNHKEQVSLQRENYDGATIPTSGFPDGYNSSEALSAMEGVQLNDEFKKFFYEFSEQKDFLEARGYPRIFGNKFKRGEVMNQAVGVSHDFLFGKGKEILRLIPSSPNTLDEHSENMLASLKLFKERYTIYSIRWTPVYKIYGKHWMLNKSSAKSLMEDVKSSYTDDQIHFKEINDLIGDLMTTEDESERFRFNTFFGIDWETKQYKVKTMYLYDNLAALINTMTAAYDFSVNENSLHWNKRSI